MLIYKCCASVLLVLSLWTGSAAAEEQTTKVLFDQGHDQRFLIEESGPLQLSGLADMVREKGAHVKSTKSLLSDETLGDCTALIISGPFKSLLPEEVAAVVRFIEKGGRLAAMLHIGQPLASLLARLDVDYSNAVLHERQNVIDADINFRVKAMNPEPLFSGISAFSVYGVWALDPGPAARSVTRTSPLAWVDLNGDKVLSQGDAIAEFSVVVNGSYGAGSFVIFGDDAIFQNRYLDDDNRTLASNLASWLAAR